MQVSSGTPMLEMKDVSHTFIQGSGQKIKALKDVSLALFPKEVLAILGPSGSGKSTCLKILAGLLRPTRGKVLKNGHSLQDINSDIAMVFQNFALLPWLNIAENIGLGLEPLGLPDQEMLERVKRIVDLVGLEGFEEAYPRELSGGMKQRVGLARALVVHRPILCLDEPFSTLDVLTAETMRKEVVNLWVSQKTSIQSLVLVTHNIIEAVSLGSRILVMGSNPGHIRISIKNDLTYPRDEKSAAFRGVVEDIHDVITETIIPDTPDWIPPALSATITESIPPVSLSEVIGLLEKIAGEGGRADAFVLAQKLAKDSVHVLLMAKAAELLDLVDTPRNTILLTDLGRRFVSGDVNARKRIIHEQMKTLKLIRMLREKLEGSEDQTMPLEETVLAIQEWLPNENPEQVFETIIQWGRYGELFGYNDNKKSIYLDRPEA